MKTLTMFAVAATLLLPLAPAVQAHEKPLPPAFGKELVPSEETEERNEPKDAEMEEDRDKRDSGGARHSSAPHGPHGKIHVQLDGDEDGGDSGGDDDDGL
jgi:hypothetical protein